MTAEPAFECGQFQTLQIPDSQYAELCEPRLCHLTYTGDTPHRERWQKGSHFIRLDDEQTVRLAPIRGDLCQEFVGRDSSRSRQMQLLADLLPNRAGDS